MKRPHAQSSGAERKPPGRPFAKGQSGNPGGRPKDLEGVRELARAHTAEALDTLASIMRDGSTENARLRAAEALLERAWGRPAQALDVTSGNKPLTAGVEGARERLAQRIQALLAAGEDSEQTA